jgi:uncharacterized membrane protein YuzA (DUF378 family)
LTRWVTIRVTLSHSVNSTLSSMSHAMLSELVYSITGNSTVCVFSYFVQKDLLNRWKTTCFSSW